MSIFHPFLVIHFRYRPVPCPLLAIRFWYSSAHLFHFLTLNFGDRFILLPFLSIRFGHMSILLQFLFLRCMGIHLLFLLYLPILLQIYSFECLSIQLHFLNVSLIYWWYFWYDLYQFHIIPYQFLNHLIIILYLKPA